MAVNVSLMRAYLDGLVAVTAAGDTSVTLPTNASGALSADFFEVGAITPDGISESTSQDRTSVFIWQGNTLARQIPGEYSKTFTFAAAETNLITLGVQFAGSTITQTAEGVSVAEKAPTTDVRSWVLHGIDGTRKQRVVIPNGEVTERGDVVWSAGDITVYEWTVSCYPDLSGNILYRYYQDSSLASV
jgi:hypothetical protein